jgi:starvation-inducible DNA-binding protein
MSEITKNLTNLYASNFVLYYKTHGFHFNIQGPTFAQDHAVLEEIYSFLWEQHDMIGEQIRQMGKAVVPNLISVIDLSVIKECSSIIRTSAPMWDTLASDVEDVLGLAQWVYDTAGEESYGGLETLVGDYLKSLSKLHWKLKALQGKSFV